MAHLRYIDGNGRIQVKALDADQFTIGRAETCQLIVDSDMMSREHVRINMETDGRYRIRDLGSRNKTYVNGELITETLLTPGSIIRAGDAIVEFVDDSVNPDKIDLSFLTPDRTEPPHCQWIKSKAPLSLTLSQVENLARLRGDQALTARSEDIANAMLGQIILDLQAERGLIAMRGDSKTELTPLAHRSLKRPSGGSMTPVSQSFILAPILQSVCGRYPDTAGQIDIKLGYASTGLVAPLTYRGDIIGVLYVDRPKSKKPFAPSALSYCAAAGAHAGAALAESSRNVVRFAAREGAGWMSNIRQLQTALTDPIPESDSFNLASKCFPGRLRCGDFAAFLPLDEQRCGLVIIDGGGQGITGLTQAAAIRTAICAAISVSDDALYDPAPMFNAINQLMATSRARQVVPCQFVGIDMASGKLTYVNAGGMPPLLMVAPGRLVTLDQVSLVLGVDADYSYQRARVDLPEKFRIVCYTDGLTESVSATGQAFGDERLHETLLDHDAFGSADGVLAAVGKAYTAHLATAQTADDALIAVIARG
jgi:serine phosphatase RsbU (regulator of sigma subunit)